HLARQHAEWMALQHEEEIRQLRETIEAYDSESDIEQLAAQYDDLKRQIKELHDQSNQLKEQWRKEIQVCIENANIIPAVTRDLMNHYLQSRRPNFKVGLFFSADKTK